MFDLVVVVFLLVLELPEDVLSVEQQNETMAIKITIMTIKVNISEAGFEYMLKIIFTYPIYRISSCLILAEIFFNIPVKI